jgi:protein TonB
MLAKSRAAGKGGGEPKRGAPLLIDSSARAYAVSALLAIAIHAWFLFIWPRGLGFEPAEYGVVRGESAIEVALVAPPPASEELPVDSQETTQPPEHVESHQTMPTINEEPLPPTTPPPPDAVREVIQQGHVQPQPTPTPVPAKRKSASNARKDFPLGARNSAGTGNQAASANATSGSRMTQAAYLFNPHPSYPELARKAGHAGVVILRVSVSERGRVSALHIVKSSGYALLDDRARTTVLRWTFKPARRDGRPVSTQVEVPIRFSLDR